MPGNETYLEAFIDHISSLPHEVRRNLALIKDLDQTCSTLVDEMTQLQSDYVQRVEGKIGALEVVDGNKIRIPGSGPNGPAVVPTTEELEAYIREPLTTDKIDALESKVLQLAEEKVATADQTFEMVDHICQRLDSDLEELQAQLKAAGEFEVAGSAKPNDLAAIQVTVGSPDWILAKVMEHNVETGMYKLSDEDIESNKIFHLPEPQVVLLGGLKNLSRGDIVFAVYPDTTSFYQATVVQAPRKVSGGGSFIMVNFVDDSDEHGITHDKAVLLKHVMKPPYGVTLQ